MSDLLAKFSHYRGRYGFAHALFSGIGRKHFGVWQMAGPLVSGSFAKKYCSQHGPKGLNLGSGSNLIEGMLNVDVDPRADSYVDITNPLPFADETFDVIFSEEVLEHVDEPAGRRLVAECMRVLKPGGVIHIATPCLEYFGARVTGEDADGADINAIFYEHGHCFIYSRSKLQALMEETGFGDVTFFGYKDPKSVLGCHDSHADRFSHDPAISHYAEGRKPGSGAQMESFAPKG